MPRLWTMPPIRSGVFLQQSGCWRYDVIGIQGKRLRPACSNASLVCLMHL